MKLVVGLGNPGRRYSETRHNVGFWVASELGRRGGVRWGESPFASIGTGMIGGVTFHLLMPLTYMNNSGEAVAWGLDHFDSDPGEALIVYDDMDLDLGTLRIRPGGGDGGHRGVRSIVRAVGTEQIARLRMGIGRPPAGADPVDYVLTRFSREELPVMAGAVENAVSAIETAMLKGLDAAMNLYNG